MSRRKTRVHAPGASSASLLVRLAGSDVAMFRFLLEAHDNLALFSVLEKRPALLRLFFAPESRAEVMAALEGIASAIRLEVMEWPFPEPR